MFTLDKYILVGRDPVKCDDLLEWAKTLESNRQLARTWIRGVRVSTVFLGLDHQYGNGPPLLFETMVFGGWHDRRMWRTATWDEAITAHELVVGHVQRLSFVHEPAQRITRKAIDWLRLKWYRIRHRLYRLMP